MDNIYLKHWEYIQYNELVGKITEDNISILKEILQQLYIKNNTENSKCFAVINKSTGEINYEIINYEKFKHTIMLHDDILDNDIKQTYLEIDQKMNNINQNLQCVIVYNTSDISEYCSICVVRYPYELSYSELQISINNFYKETTSYIPTLNDVINCANLNTIKEPEYLIQNLLFGELRNKLIYLMLKSNYEEGIIIIKFVTDTNIILQFIDKQACIEFAKTSNYDKHIELFTKYNSKCDLFIMFMADIDNENSYYYPLIIQNYIFLKDIKFRKKLYNYNIYIEKNKENEFLNKLLQTHMCSIIKNMVHSKFGATTIENNVLWNQYICNTIDTTILSKIKHKVNNYKRNDLMKFKQINDLTVENTIKILISYNYKCDECGIEVIIDYKSRCFKQFSLDRIDDKLPHNYDNIRLTCLSCNINHMKYVYYSGCIVFNNFDKNIIISNCTKCSIKDHTQ